jgi:hypothetical protein
MFIAATAVKVCVLLSGIDFDNHFLFHFSVLMFCTIFTACSQMLNSGTAVKVCDAYADDSSNAAD